MDVLSRIVDSIATHHQHIHIVKGFDATVSRICTGKIIPSLSINASRGVWVREAFHYRLLQFDRIRDVGVEEDFIRNVEFRQVGVVRNCNDLRLFAQVTVYRTNEPNVDSDAGSRNVTLLVKFDFSLSNFSKMFDYRVGQIGTKKIQNTTISTVFQSNLQC